MKKIRKILRLAFLVDIFSALIVWELIYYFRLYFLTGELNLRNSFCINGVHYFEMCFVPVCWVVFYYFSGDYHNYLQKNYIVEFKIVFIRSLVGCTVLFLIIFLNDINSASSIEYDYYYVSLSTFIVTQIIFTISGRIFVLNKMYNTLRSRKILINVLVISDKEDPYDFLKNIVTNNMEGYNIIGSVYVRDEEIKNKKNYIDTISGIGSIIDINEVDFVIINCEEKSKTILTKCISILLAKNIELKIVPDFVDILSGSVKTNNILGLDLIDVNLGLMPLWEQRLKRIIDIVFSFLFLIVLSPLFLYIIFRIKLNSKGDLFYKQHRVGYKNKLFTIYKFRSMNVDSEKDGVPRLAQDNDDRIYKWGRIMRKWRLDELPQLWNVLKGDMSIIGPRPERYYFIKQLEDSGIEYGKLILRVKPGLSSLGIVRYGYASSIEEMKNRIKFDLIYIENISVLLDLRIAIETINIILKGKGK